MIELVIVVAVLAILTAIAIPAFNGVAEDGRDSAAKTNIATAARECAADRIKNASSAVHTALIAGNGITYTAGLTGTGCTSTAALVCVDNSTQKTYGINLVTGEKIAGGTAISALAPCTGTVTDAW